MKPLAQPKVERYLYRSHAQAWECSLCRSCDTGRRASTKAFPRRPWEQCNRSHAPRGNAAIPPARSANKNLSSAFCLLSSERGISLIELIMYIVIVSVAMAGIMMVLNANSTFSADPFVKKQARAAAESLLEEIELHDFLPSGWTGAAIQANRSNFNDVMDYNGFATSGVYPANGAVAVSGLGDYNVSVAVVGMGFGNITSASAVQITVTVNNLNASQVVEAIGYRVDY